VQRASPIAHACGHAPAGPTTTQLDNGARPTGRAVRDANADPVRAAPIFGCAL